MTLVQDKLAGFFFSLKVKENILQSVWHCWLLEFLSCIHYNYMGSLKNNYYLRNLVQEELKKIVIHIPKYYAVNLLFLPPQLYLIGRGGKRRPRHDSCPIACFKNLTYLINDFWQALQATVVGARSKHKEPDTPDCCSWGGTWKVTSYCFFCINNCVSSFHRFRHFRLWAINIYCYW